MDIALVYAFAAACYGLFLFFFGLFSAKFATFFSASFIRKDFFRTYQWKNEPSLHSLATSDFTTYCAVQFFPRMGHVIGGKSYDISLGSRDNIISILKMGKNLFFALNTILYNALYGAVLNKAKHLTLLIRK